jgi:hypothetical protein
MVKGMASSAEWHILQSSVLRAVAYHEGARELRVRFTSGANYRYFDVPPDVVRMLLDPPGESHGRYFNAHIRDAFDYDEES